MRPRDASEREKERTETGLTLGLDVAKSQHGLAWITRLFVIPTEGLGLETLLIDSRPQSYRVLRADRGICLHAVNQYAVVGGWRGERP